MKCSLRFLLTSTAHTNNLTGNQREGFAGLVTEPVLISANASEAAGGAQILSLTYNFNLGNGASGSDNGNVIQIANGKNSNRTQNFIYDPLNRIQQAYTSGPNWGETYASVATTPGAAPPQTDQGIDPWGNLTNRSGVTGKTTYEPLSCAANTANQLNTCYTYDAAGNLIQNGSANYVYDAENRLIAAGGYSYLYDGDGQRIEKCTEGTVPGTCSSTATGTFYWKLADGSTQAESDLGGNWTADYGLIRGRIVDRVDIASGSNVDVRYYFQDNLHSTSIVTDCCGNILKESDYYPYGSEIVITGGDPNRYKFTGKEHDTESGSDYFGARYYASSMGRFMTPDWSQHPDPVPYADLGDPQSLNLYSYVRNNPLNRVDPDGHKLECTSGTTVDENGGIKVTVTCHEESFAEEVGDVLGSFERKIYNFLSKPSCPGCVGGPVSGSLANAFNPFPNRPPLRIIHNEPPLKGTADYEKWNKKSTQEIIDSLAPGPNNRNGELTIYDDGAIINGNTRITILMERGVDVNSLPAAVESRVPMDDLGIPEIDFPEIP